ncbi:MAG TPA: hypothetical protein VHZ73_05615 [Vicinamibacterales bacterium]|nr:hypothetical protein [Vicinamibacterales bacterium]
MTVGPTPSERLARADARVREGCLECLFDAYREFNALQSVPGSAELAAAGAVRSAALIALRERELGMIDENYLDRARAAAASAPSVQANYGPVLDVLDVVASRITGQSDESIRRFQTLNANRAQWLEMLRARADSDPLSAAVWISFSCTNNQNRDARTRDALLAPLTTLKSAPIVEYQLLVCLPADKDLADFQDAHGNYHEVDFWIGQRNIAAQLLDEAEQRFESAYKWHPAWPSAMTSLAALLMTAEEFEAALDMSDRVLAIAPNTADAKLNRLRALSYLGKNDAAIDQATTMIATNAMPSDAYYWRAWNENQKDELEPAWADVETAERMWHNNEVLKLAGMVAYRRHELQVSKAKFESVLQIPGPADCDVLFDLADVNIELSSWEAGAGRYAETAACIDGARRALAGEIAKLQESGGAPDRIGRQVARREAMRAAALRMQVQSWFNGSVAYLQLHRNDDARRFAEHVVDDQEFGERAREVLARIR